MARTAYGKHSTQVDTATYPDDPSVPIGSDEWNASPSDSGMLGFSAETIASATSITPSNTVLNLSGSTDVATIAQGNTNEYDLLYVFTSGTVTLVHNTGNLQLISGANKDLSTTIPTILIRKGTDWVEYGGGGNVTGTVMSGHIIPDTDATYDIGSASYKIRDLYLSDSSLHIGDVSISRTSANTLTCDGTWVGNVTGNVTGNTSGTALSVTNESQPNITSVGTLTGLTVSGDLTVNGTTTTINSTTLTVDDKNIEMGSVTTPTDTTANGGGITLKGSTDKTISWQNSTDSWTFNQSIDLGANHMTLSTVSEPADPSTGEGRVYVNAVDANNDGIFIKIKKDGSIQEVQIA